MSVSKEEFQHDKLGLDSSTTYGVAENDERPKTPSSNISTDQLQTSNASDEINPICEADCQVSTYPVDKKNTNDGFISDISSEPFLDSEPEGALSFSSTNKLCFEGNFDASNVDDTEPKVKLTSNEDNHVNLELLDNRELGEDYFTSTKEVQCTEESIDSEMNVNPEEEEPADTREKSDECVDMATEEASLKNDLPTEDAKVNDSAKTENDSEKVDTEVMDNSFDGINRASEQEGDFNPKYDGATSNIENEQKTESMQSNPSSSDAPIDSEVGFVDNTETKDVKSKLLDSDDPVKKDTLDLGTDDATQEADKQMEDVERQKTDNGKLSNSELVKEESKEFSEDANEDKPMENETDFADGTAESPSEKMEQLSEKEGHGSLNSEAVSEASVQSPVKRGKRSRGRHQKENEAYERSSSTEVMECAATEDVQECSVQLTRLTDAHCQEAKIASIGCSIPHPSFRRCYVRLHCLAQAFSTLAQSKCSVVLDRLPNHMIPMLPGAATLQNGDDELCARLLREQTELGRSTRSKRQKTRRYISE